jgi:tetrahydromethanopterin S-methyltransferase subunit C
LWLFLNLLICNFQRNFQIIGKLILEGYSWTHNIYLNHCIANCQISWIFIVDNIVVKYPFDPVLIPSAH